MAREGDGPGKQTTTVFQPRKTELRMSWTFDFVSEGGGTAHEMPRVCQGVGIVDPLNAVGYTRELVAEDAAGMIMQTRKLKEALRFVFPPFKPSIFSTLTVTVPPFRCFLLLILFSSALFGF